ncbi:hypothetical protein WJX72_007597 [[Myrmecia] bisecta]|uniref:Methionine synthase reductase n=1 Tax=[Myrmecia] bisecta TaxID=41462 RepID=A0AAW1QC59_9CHLO
MQGQAPSPSANGSAKPAPQPEAAQKAGFKPGQQLANGGSAPVAASGGGAILARLRAAREKHAAEAAGRAAASGREVVVAYASQTGTSQEIARNIQAECSKHGIARSRVVSFDELGFEDVAAGKVPILAMIASSTGDGDVPDNAVKFLGKLKRKSQPEGLLKDVQFTVLGLGDSNYTRYMAVPRAFRTRFTDLGAACFYDCLEADEVDGLEEFVDRWVAGLWGPLKQAALPTAVGDNGPPANGKSPGAAAAADNSSESGAGDGLVGVPALAPTRVALVWEADRAQAERVAAAEAAHPTAADLAERDVKGMYSPETPFWARVADARYLTAPTSERKVLHVAFDVSGSGMAYHPGDSLGLLPENDPALVDGLLARLGQDGAAIFSVRPVGSPADSAAPATSSAGSAGSASSEASGAPRLLPHLRWPCTLRWALLHGCDLTSAPRKSLLRLLGEHCGDAAQRRQLLLLASRGGKDAYAKEIREGQPSLLDLLQRFPSCQPPLAALLDALPPLAPRMYSIASSPLEHPGQAHVAFSVVRFLTANGQRQGVATTWLAKLVEPITSGRLKASELTLRLPLYLRSGGAFRPPEDLQVPSLMIGPGTGVAPFRGFLQHRRQLLRQRPPQAGAGSQAEAAGPAWLFFGCRTKQDDYLYGDEWDAFVKDGTLSHYEVAFSRAQASKVYVQHLMQQQGEALHRLVTAPGAHIFVCGDGALMAKDVHATLVSLLEKNGSMTSAEASAALAAMTKEKRYIRDIWS